MDAARALIVLLGAAAAGCGAAPAAVEPRVFVHPSSAQDALLLEVLASAPADKVPPSALEIALKMPLVIPDTAIKFARGVPEAVAVVLYLPYGVVRGLLEAVGIVKPEREAPDLERVRPR